MKETLHTQISPDELLLPVIAYGDAIGLPFEAKRPSQQGSINELQPLKTNDYLDIPEETRGKTGVWSDDTHLSLASALSLIRSNGFDIQDQALAHIQAIRAVRGDDTQAAFIPPITTKSRKNGFGKSTVNSIDRLDLGISPEESGERGGAGNGVLMKLAPLVYWQYITNVDTETAVKQITDFTVMTHNSPEAIVCSQVHRVILTQLLDMDSEYDGDYVSKIYSDAVYTAELFEEDIDPDHKTSKVLKRLSDEITYGFPTVLNRNAILTKAEKGGFYAPETLMMAYASFILEPRFPESAHRAAELGGDSDSIASIVSGMSAFYWGDLTLPEDIQQVFAYERLRRVSKDLSKLALNGRL